MPDGRPSATTAGLITSRRGSVGWSGPRYPDAMPAQPPRVDDVEPTDGRRARGARTRLAVLETLLAMVGEGQLHPSAQDVATRAGLALRTVYHHFEDVEQLRRAALQLQLERTGAVLRPIEPAADLESRIRTIARQLRTRFEAMTPIRRATLFDEHNSAATALGLGHYRVLRRNHVARTFAAEIERSGARGRDLLDALDTTTTWECWEYQRSALGRSAATTEKTLVRMLDDLLTERAAQSRRHSTTDATPALTARSRVSGSGGVRRRASTSARS
jgi:AcrR family transcriptional regulator